MNTNELVTLVESYFAAEAESTKAMDHRTDLEKKDCMLSEYRASGYQMGYAFDELNKARNALHGWLHERSNQRALLAWIKERQ